MAEIKIFDIINKRHDYVLEENYHDEGHISPSG